MSVSARISGRAFAIYEGSPVTFGIKALLKEPAEHLKRPSQRCLKPKSPFFFDESFHQGADPIKLRKNPDGLCCDACRAQGASHVQIQLVNISNSGSESRRNATLAAGLSNHEAVKRHDLAR